MIISYGYQGDHLIYMGWSGELWHSSGTISDYVIHDCHNPSILYINKVLLIYMLVMLVQQEHLRPGWWFGTCFIFPYIGNFIMPTDFQWLPYLFQRGWNHQPETMPCFSWYIVYPSIHLIFGPQEEKMDLLRQAVTFLCVKQWLSFGNLWKMDESTRLSLIFPQLSMIFPLQLSDVQGFSMFFPI